MPPPRSTTRFAPVRADASEQIAEEIRRYVAAGDLRPGDRLGTEGELAAEFGVSRTTLREGLRRLAGSHLIRAEQGHSGGIFVANTLHGSMGRNVSEVVAAMVAGGNVPLPKLLQARTFLETPLAGLAAQNADEATIDALAGTIEHLERSAPGGTEFARADIAFHELLAITADNELMVAFTTWTLDVLVPSLIERLGAVMDPAQIIAQHKAILRAIRRGQRAGAEKAMARHMAYLEELVAGLPEGGR